MKLSVVLALLFASLSCAGESIPKEVTLEQLVRQASLVVVAVRDTPYRTNRVVELDHRKPAYPYATLGFRALEILYGRLASPGSMKLRTVGADLGTLLNLERSGLSKSFYSPYFPEGKGLLESRDTLILFLREANDRGEHPFVADDACLPSSRKARIKELFTKLP